MLSHNDSKYEFERETPLVSINVYSNTNNDNK